MKNQNKVRFAAQINRIGFVSKTHLDSILLSLLLFFSLFLSLFGSLLFSIFTKFKIHFEPQKILICSTLSLHCSKGSRRNLQPSHAHAHIPIHRPHPLVAHTWLIYAQSWLNVYLRSEFEMMRMMKWGNGFSWNGLGWTGGVVKPLERISNENAQ